MNGAEKKEDVSPPSSTPCNGAEKQEGRDPVRLSLRAYADRVMEAATFIPKPDSFLEGERAGRYAAACERMLTQLYAPPKSKTPGFDAEDEDRDTPAPYVKPGSQWVEEEGMFQWQLDLEQKLLRIARHAKSTGFFPNGTPYPAEDPVANQPPDPLTDSKAEPLWVPPNTEPAPKPEQEPPELIKRASGMIGTNGRITRQSPQAP
jgi:hypothetical protein